LFAERVSRSSIRLPKVVDVCPTYSSLAFCRTWIARYFWRAGELKTSWSISSTSWVAHLRDAQAWARLCRLNEDVSGDARGATIATHTSQQPAPRFRKRASKRPAPPQCGCKRETARLLVTSSITA